MPKSVASKRSTWVAPVVLIVVLGFAIAICVWFLNWLQTPLTGSDFHQVCGQLPEGSLAADCIALRSTIATERAAVSAERALWVSFGSMLVGVASIFGLLFVWLQGRGAIELAAEANRITLENGQAQARAYVVIQSVECQLNQQGHLVTRVGFHNSGLSPARGVRWLFQAKLNIVPEGQEPLCLEMGAEPNLEKSHWRQDISAGVSWVSRPHGLLVSEKSDVIDTINDAVFIAATIKIMADYADVFGVRHDEVACFQGRIALADQPYSNLDRAHDSACDV
ncbi:hypothetical protein FF124_14850 [Martelella lutilitoris]|uniref:Uncharacterized protein n=1 Tax=Martelella lutilitoris TaxID=2583532 RepID=A0A5C4JNY6_9HYPH|nr:hypothetical protein [Martelella lutilitoris]TNB46834.1 hypothetical protein FF124_14850 [Martelella lutilitoris]